jgi:Fic family protein
MRTFERTHPWIRFELDLRRLPHRVWLLLGEAQSKCEHIAGVPLRPDTALKLHRLFLARGALATTAIEGNTLSEEEALAVIDERLELPESRAYLGREILNIAGACDKIVSGVRSASGGLSSEQILEFNRAILHGLPPKPDVVPGQVRTHPVRVAQYHGAPHEDCAWLLDRLCGWLNQAELRGSPGERIALAVVRAVLAHIFIAWIHPFGDGNGRTARLVEFSILLAAGVPSPAAHLLSNHYNQTRSEYYRQLQAASASGGDLIPFIAYAVEGFVDGLREQLAHIREQQTDIAWRNLVDEAFRNAKTVTAIRQRDLVLDLSQKPGWVVTAEIPTLSPQLARAYASKKSKTVTRDINALVELGLIERVGPRVRAKREIILAFLPPQRADEVRDESGSSAAPKTR